MNKPSQLDSNQLESKQSESNRPEPPKPEPNGKVKVDAAVPIFLVAVHIGMMASFLFERFFYESFEAWYLRLENFMLAAGYFPGGIILTLLYYATMNTLPFLVLQVLSILSLLYSFCFTVYILLRKPKFIWYPLIFLTFNLLIVNAQYGIIKNDWVDSYNHKVLSTWTVAAEKSRAIPKVNYDYAKEYIEKKYGDRVVLFEHDDNYSSDDYFDVQLKGDDFTFEASVSAEKAVSDNYVESQIQYLLGLLDYQFNMDFVDLAQKQGLENILIYCTYSVNREESGDNKSLNEVFTLEELSQPDAANYVLNSGRLKSVHLTVHYWDQNFHASDLERALKPFVKSVFQRLGDIHLEVDFNNILYTDAIPIKIEQAQQKINQGTTLTHAERHMLTLDFSDEGSVDQIFSGLNEESYTYQPAQWLLLSDDDIRQWRESVNDIVTRNLETGDKSLKGVYGKHLGASSFSESDISNQVSRLLEQKYGRKMPLRVVSYLYLDQSVETEYIYMRLKASDAYETEFTAIVDVTRFQLRPSVYLDDYLPRYYENYLKNEVFKLNELVADKAVVETDISLSYEDSLEYINNFKDNRLDALALGSNLKINIIQIEKRDKISDSQLVCLMDRMFPFTKRLNDSGLFNLQVSFMVESRNLFGFGEAEQKLIHPTLFEFTGFQDTYTKESWSYEGERFKAEEKDYLEIKKAYKSFRNW